ncbi:MAG: serine hydrolase [Rhodospirillales bacterium]|nr:serine hydrolase [Rhodospirillales bacterium]
MTDTRARIWIPLVAAALTCCGLSIARAAPDEELLGKGLGYPVGTRATWFADEKVRVGSFSQLDSILPHNTLARAEAPRPLPAAAETPAYVYAGRTIDDFLARRRITGLMVIKDGVVQIERYQYDRTPAHRFLSNSMAKSITSIAVGIALQEGLIKSLDDNAAVYVPELAGAPYGETPIRALLRMSSGVKFSERYDGNDDLMKDVVRQHREGTFAALRGFSTRDLPPGQRFQYASVETIALGLVVRGATGRTLSDSVAEKLWRPMGAEADATWTVDPGRVEYAWGNFNATLRDWGRLAILLADDGARDDRQIIPRDYLREATDFTRHPAAFAPRIATPYFGYGYQFWTYPTKVRRFALLGVFGQSIFVDPRLRLALVITAAQREANSSTDGFGAERDQLWRALVQHHGGSW